MALTPSRWTMNEHSRARAISHPTMAEIMALRKGDESEVRGRESAIALKL